MRSMLCGNTRLGSLISLTVCWLASGTAPGQEPATPAPHRLDLYGDPLPAGAIARLGTLRFRHGGDVNTVAFLADGKTVVSGSANGVRLWEAASGKELRTLPGYRVIVSPDGKTLATLDVNEQSTFGRIHLIDAVSGKTIRQFDRGLATLTLAFSPDGKTLAAAGHRQRNQNQVWLWEVATGNELPSPLMGRRYDTVNRLAFSPDGKTLATSGDRDDSVRFWELATGMEQAVLGHNGQALAYSPDGKLLALEGWDRADEKNEKSVVRLFETDNFKEVRQLAGLRGGVGAIVFSRDGATVAAGSRDGQLLLWETATGKELRALTGHRDSVTALAYAPDGKQLVSGSKDKTICVWDLATGQPLQALAGHQGWVSSVALSPDGKTAITAGWDRTVRLWDLAASQELQRLAHSAPVRTIALAPDGKLLASQSGSHTRSDAVVRLWDLATGKELRQFPEQPGWPMAVTFSPDSRILASGNNLAVQLWDAATGKALRRVTVPQDQAQNSAIPFISFAADGKSFAWSNYVHGRLTEAGTGRELSRFSIPKSVNTSEEIGWGAFAPDGTTLVLRTENTIRVWDAVRAKELRAFRADPLSGISQAALSPDGKMLATANLMGTIRIWELATGKERRELQGAQQRVHSAVPKYFPAHQGSATAVAWSADGKRLITGGEDSTVLVWDLSLPDDLPARFRNPSAQDLETFWHDLTADDAGQAYRAMRLLIASPQKCVTFLKDRLRPAAAVEPRAVDKLIANLDSQQFVIRQQAVEELEMLGAQAVSALEQVLTGNPSLEVRQRVEELLEKIDRFTLSGKSLRAWRAIEVLEHLCSEESRQILEALAKGTSEPRLTREAKAALHRSAQQSAP